jgi:hypothetical protein
MESAFLSYSCAFCFAFFPKLAGDSGMHVSAFHFSVPSGAAYSAHLVMPFAIFFPFPYTSQILGPATTAKDLIDDGLVFPCEVYHLS